MLNLQDEAKAYIESVLGVTTQLTPATPAVPFNIRDSYEIFELSLLMTKHSTLSMVLLVAKDGDDYPGIVKLRKHIDLVHAATRQVIAYVCRSLTVQHRRSLITHQVNFIQPGFQMFLPEIALDLRESFRQRREQSDVAALLPAAQAMLLSCLRAGKTGQACFTTSALLGDLDYSRVTLSKAVDQLTSLQVINPVKSELQWNTYAFSGSPAEVFQKARQYLRSPVKKKVGITRNTLPMAPGVFMAGESALASYTMLAAPQQAVWGMTRKVFNDMLALQAFEASESVDTIEEWVEVWAYPSLSEAQHQADPASLFLSLEGNPDERVQMALDQLREQVEWLV